MKSRPPQFLLIDVGNTRTKWATVGVQKKIQLRGEISTKDVSSKWATSLARKFPASRVVLASVVPKTRKAFRQAFGRRLIEVSATLRELRFVFRYPKPTELGADRLAAATALHDRGEFPAVIVACGTATAFTVLDAKGRLCGGAIAPAPSEAQLCALLGATAQLPATSLRMPRNAIARTTRDAIRVGVLLGFQGGVKEIIRELSDTLPAPPHVILTGGNAKHLVEHLEIPFKLRPLLVFEGLLIIAGRLT